MQEYRCTRNALYQHNCAGQHDLTARQGHYLRANSKEEAWHEMAKRFPDETKAGFTVDEWEGFDVVIKEVPPDRFEAEFARLQTVVEQVEQQRVSPYPSLQVPEYRVGRHGNWFLDRADPMLVRGYFTGIQPASGNYRLFCGETLWMSLTPRELESQAHHALYARGHTVIMGLGMGVLLYNVIAREEVEKVTVVEGDPHAVKLLHQIADPKTWKGWEKVNMTIADALEWKPNDPVDFLAVDIWEKLGDENLRSHGQQIQKNVRAKQVALWGQELDFITFAIERGYSALPTLGQYREYIEAIGIPLIESDNPDYPGYCLRAVEQVMS
jgi:hypothetical protein